MYCKNCGNKLPDNALFCIKCKAKINAGRAELSKTKKLPYILAAAGVTILAVCIIFVIVLYHGRKANVQSIAESEETSVEENVPDTDESETAVEDKQKSAERSGQDWKRTLPSITGRGSTVG